MRTTLIRFLALAATASLLAGCMSSGQPRYGDSRNDSRYQSRQDDYRYNDRYDNRYDNRCETCGVVELVEPVWVRNDPSGGGALLGAVIGGLVGSNVGSGSGRDVATVAGAVAGGVIGHQAERQRQRDEHPAYLFRVRLDDGRWGEVTQRDDYGLRRGDRVMIRNREVTPLR